MSFVRILSAQVAAAEEELDRRRARIEALEAQRAEMVADEARLSELRVQYHEKQISEQQYIAFVGDLIDSMDARLSKIKGEEQ